MAKHRLPLQSGQVSGKMDENRVFATLHGRTYSKRYVVPKQPNTFLSILFITSGMIMLLTLFSCGGRHAAHRYTNMNDIMPRVPLKTDIFVRVLGFAFNDSLYFSSPPRVRFKGNLEYPESTRWAALEGVVKLLLSVDMNGDVAEVMLHKSCGCDSLDEAAFRGMAKAKFFPPVQRSLAGGKIPSLCYFIVEIEFRLLPRRDRPRKDG